MAKVKGNAPEKTEPLVGKKGSSEDKPEVKKGHTLVAKTVFEPMQGTHRIVWVKE